MKIKTLPALLLAGTCLAATVPSYAYLPHASISQTAPSISQETNIMNELRENIKEMKDYVIDLNKNLNMQESLLDGTYYDKYDRRAERSDRYNNTMWRWLNDQIDGGSNGINMLNTEQREILEKKMEGFNSNWG